MSTMDHADHVELLRDGIPGTGGTWADFGAGSGAFTLALAELLRPGSELYAVDRDRRALERNEEAMRSRFSATTVHYLATDFTRPVELPMLAGIVAANTLHFHRGQAELARLWRGYLGPGGRFIVVEYNILRPNIAVPHPLPFSRWAEVAGTAGFAHTELLMRRPSRSLHEIYSAVSW